MKKGQGISINIIVIAAIALLVLVILSVLVIRAGKNVNDGTQCQATGGSCENPDSATLNGCPATRPNIDLTTGCKANEDGSKRICCRDITS